MKNITMRVAIGADHGGFALKKGVISILGKSGCKVKDFGAFSSERCDYPPIGYKVASAVASGKFERGILICKSGIGMCLVANKVPRVRAALLRDIKDARFSRQHNDANIAVFSANATGKNNAKKMLKVWLAAEFLGGRHARRVRQISAIEKKAKRGR